MRGAETPFPSALPRHDELAAPALTASPGHRLVRGLEERPGRATWKKSPLSLGLQKSTGHPNQANQATTAKLQSPPTEFQRPAAPTCETSPPPSLFLLFHDPKGRSIIASPESLFTYSPLHHFTTPLHRRVLGVCAKLELNSFPFQGPALCFFDI